VVKPITLHPDQADLIERVRQAMRRHKSVLMQSATGSGKTVMAADMVQRSIAKGTRSLFVVPRRELLRQTAETFAAFGIAHGYVAAGYPANPFAQVQLATSGTLARRLDTAPRSHVVFVDETHYGGDDLDRIVRHYQAAGAWIVGLSATPWKMSGKGLGDWYDAMEEGLPVADLIASGRLSDYRLFAPHRPDLSGIRTTAGDYAKGALAERMEGDRVLIGNAVKHYCDHAAGRLSVAFCTSIKHAEIVADAFMAAGVPAAMVSGSMGDDERSRRIKAFARRQLHVLTSVDLLTFGFDLASAAQMDVTIEAMSDMRPTKSLSLQCQKWGRVLRRKDTPALIFDHAGNTDEHGLPDAPREWSLDGRKKREAGDKEPRQPVRQCERCYMVHRPAPNCPACGFEYPVQSRMVDEVEGELTEIDAARARVQARQEQGRAQTLDDLIRLERIKGYKPGWARLVWRARQSRHAAR